MTLNIIGHRKIFYVLSGLSIVACLFSIFVWHFKVGIDFAGGSLWEIDTHQSVGADDLNNVLRGAGVSDATIQNAGGTDYQLRFREIDEQTHQQLLSALKSVYPNIEEKRFETVGPTIGASLRQKAIESLVAVLIAISLYIAWAFRRVSRTMASWKYGTVTIFTLFHDVIIPAGLFSILGKLHNIEIDSNFIVALLVIMGFSVHDTIVVFDRTRENLKKAPQGETFGQTVNRSLNQTFVRSVNTSLAVLLTLAALYFFGSVTLKYFILALFVGIFVGTYSSIFIASPILVEWEKWHNRGIKSRAGK